MDTTAYLKRQGWRGDGHSLDHSGRGIRKPLLVSKKIDVLGVGLNKHAAVSDQWWMRAFDEGLKNLGTGKESALGNLQKHGVHRGGLYGRFVKGEGVPGTIGESAKPSGASAAASTRDQAISVLAKSTKACDSDLNKVVSMTRKVEKARRRCAKAEKAIKKEKLARKASAQGKKPTVSEQAAVVRLEKAKEKLVKAERKQQKAVRAAAREEKRKARKAG